ncbi:MAG: hypothetical protein WAN65_24965 [Candidatus Sulfotelmatobacter sp.]
MHVKLEAQWAKEKKETASSDYVFSYSALKHFALGGAISIYNNAIGLMALLSAETSIETLRFLCDLVNDEMAGSLSPYQISIDAFEIRHGTVVTVSMPFPSEIPEAYMIAIATNASLARASDQKEETAEINTLYFSLERAAPRLGYPRTMVGRWDRSSRKNYGDGPIPAVANFVECVERIWVSEIWREEMKRT